MGFFRRSVPEPRRGFPIYIQEYQAEIGTRPELPLEGRYWVAMAETNGKQGLQEVTRLVWENPATYYEAKTMLKEFEKECGKRAKRVTELHSDDVHGVWVAEPKGRPIAILMIFHPVIFTP